MGSFKTNVIKTNPTDKLTHDLTDCHMLELGSQKDNTHSRPIKTHLTASK